MRLILIGYWQADRTPWWPDPRRFIDPAWDSAERESIVEYLHRGVVARAYLGKSLCRLCGEAVGSVEQSDGVFIWPEGLAHYVEEHKIRLPHRFISHVRRRMEQLEDAEIEEDWWKSQSPP